MILYLSIYLLIYLPIVFNIIYLSPLFYLSTSYIFTSSLLLRRFFLFHTSLFVLLFIGISTFYPFNRPPFDQPINQSIYLSLYPSTYLSTYQFIYPICVLDSSVGRALDLDIEIPPYLLSPFLQLSLTATNSLFDCYNTVYNNFARSHCLWAVVFFY